jgi:ABC-type polysaccharide/polyol phosphate transport system ATPase subunit
MTNIAIKSESLGKCYTIGHRSSEPYQTFREMLLRQTSAIAKSMKDVLHGRPLIIGDIKEEFWALRNLNFDVEHGDVVGIIGRNGAGKSTLLKLLSRITAPSEGRVAINGRVASLLEVGTGFHPELTGRENIFLNGAILGMTAREIRSKFDEIVDFAGVERFLDTPVKRYSSGMYVRLAFSIAAHLEPEILIVDEVLAVGDAEFQKKCLGKMHDVSTTGRTVLFVSHNMGAVRSLCTKGLLLKSGGTTGVAPIGDVLKEYEESFDNDQSVPYSDRIFLNQRVSFSDAGGFQCPEIIFHIRVRGPLVEPHVGIVLFNEQSVRVATILSDTVSRLPDIEDGEELALTFRIRDVQLAPQRLRVRLVLSTSEKNIEIHENYSTLEIEGYHPFPYSGVVNPTGTVFIRPETSFELRKRSHEDES